MKKKGNKKNLLALFVFPILFHSTKESRMHGVLNEVYLQTFLGMGVTFRNESNDGN